MKAPVSSSFLILDGFSLQKYFQTISHGNLFLLVLKRELIYFRLSFLLDLVSSRAEMKRVSINSSLNGLTTERDVKNPEWKKKASRSVEIVFHVHCLSECQSSSRKSN
jgi:hypothetical protein